MTIFIFTTIFLSSLSLAFIRPFTTECVIDESEDNFLFGLTPNIVNDDDDDYEDLVRSVDLNQVKAEILQALPSHYSLLGELFNKMCHLRTKKG